MKEENIVLELHNLTVSYNNKPAIWNIDFSVPEGRLVGIIGPNGSGKTTMLKAIMGLIEPASGYVKLFDKSLDEVRQRISYVPQRGTVDWDFPATVFDVVLMGRYKPKNLFRRTKRQDKEIALECLRKVQLEKFRNRQISQLSGGQQQRVFIARALVQEADLYIMDEPFAGVDAATENAIITLLKEMKQQNKTVIVVHHDLQTATNYFDWLILMNTRLIAAGALQDVFTQEKLDQTYGVKLNILAQVGDLMREQSYPVREKE
jgi:manganese/zinc/iron transport system ATP- binding protein